MNSKQKISHVTSWLLHPLVLPLYVMVLLLTQTVFALYPLDLRFYLFSVAVLYTVIIPLLSLGLLQSLGRVADWDVDRRRERILPLAIGVVCYLLCALTLSRIVSATFLCKFMLAAACCEAMCLVVSLRWKISLHMTAMGTVTALLAVLNVIDAGSRTILGLLIAAVLCSGVLASARLYLGSHNGWQVFAGFCGGFVITIFVLLFVL